MDSEQAKAGFSISNLLGFDRAQAEQPENSDNRHQLNLSENTGERERERLLIFVLYFTQTFNILRCFKGFYTYKKSVESFILKNANQKHN